MDIVRLRIPYGFIRDRTRLSWREVQFGLINDLIDPAVPIEMAVEQVGELEAPNAALLELAGMTRDEPTQRLVEQLAAGETWHPESEAREKWLYLVLAWIYEHREHDPDPLQRVEEVYADFGYPERIAAFVRYMPPDEDDPDIRGRATGEGRLLERWKQYLDEVASKSGALEPLPSSALGPTPPEPAPCDDQDEPQRQSPLPHARVVRPPRKR